jgi:hypothetical protein
MIVPGGKAEIRRMARLESRTKGEAKHKKNS